MKKFIIVIVFVFLIALLISFNYLLWDREKQLANYQDLSDSKNFTIDTLGEKNNSLAKQNKQQSDQIEAMDKENSSLRGENSQLLSDNADLKNELAAKNDLIAAFKKSINVVPLENVIKKWVDAISTKNYKNAQLLISKNSTDTTLNDAEQLKEAYQKEVKAINLKTSELFTKLTDDEHIGKIQFKVVLTVEKPDSTDDNKGKAPEKLFKSGDNEKYITMEYNTQSNEWLILEVKDNP